VTAAAHSGLDEPGRLFRRLAVAQDRARPGISVGSLLQNFRDGGRSLQLVSSRDQFDDLLNPWPVAVKAPDGFEQRVNHSVTVTSISDGLRLQQ